MHFVTQHCCAGVKRCQVQHHDRTELDFMHNVCIGSQKALHSTPVLSSFPAARGGVRAVAWRALDMLSGLRLATNERCHQRFCTRHQSVAPLAECLLAPHCCLRTWLPCHSLQDLHRWPVKGQQTVTHIMASGSHNPHTLHRCTNGAACTSRIDQPNSQSACVCAAAPSNQHVCQGACAAVCLAAAASCSSILHCAHAPQATPLVLGLIAQE
jgi:hypothetical protein